MFQPIPNVKSNDIKINLKKSFFTSSSSHKKVIQKKQLERAEKINRIINDFNSTESGIYKLSSNSSDKLILTRKLFIEKYEDLLKNNRGYLLGLAEKTVKDKSEAYFEPVINAINQNYKNIKKRTDEMTKYINALMADSYDDKTFNASINSYNTNTLPAYKKNREKSKNAINSALTNLENNKDKIIENIIESLKSNIADKTNKKLNELLKATKKWISVVGDYKKRCQNLEQGLNQLLAVLKSDKQQISEHNAEPLEKCFNNRNWINKELDKDDLVPRKGATDTTNRILISMMSSLTDTGTEKRMDECVHHYLRTGKSHLS